MVQLILHSFADRVSKAGYNYIGEVILNSSNRNETGKKSERFRQNSCEPHNTYVPRWDQVPGRVCVSVLCVKHITAVS